MNKNFGVHLRLRCTFLSLAIALCGPMQVRAQQAQVWTWHNDNGRRGQNTSETTLTPSNVKSTQFGQLCSYAVDGQVYAQPLVLWDAANNRNVVYVVTQNDSIYMFNGTNCGLIASNTSLVSSLMPPGQGHVSCDNIGGKHCGVISPWVGILGTPVIDENTNHIYLVTYSTVTQNGVSNYYYWLHALTTGLAPLTTPLVEESAYGSPKIISSGTFIPNFDPATHIQRPGLLLLPSTQSASAVIYIGFSMMDGNSNYPPGFVFAYNGQNFAQSPQVYTTEPTTQAHGGGIWMGGAGLAAGVDSSGGSTYIYVTTADGNFDTNTGGSLCVDCADSFIKLTTGTGGLSESSFFAPYDALCRFVDAAPPTNPDADFGSGGVMLIPDNLLSAYPYLAVSADKPIPPATNGNIYVIPRSSPGLYNPPTDCTHGSNSITETIPGTGLYHNTPAFWQTGTNSGYLYYAPAGGVISQYPVQSTCTSGGQAPVCNATHTSVDISGNSAKFGDGTTPSISSNGTSNGIVWALTGMSTEGTNMGGLWAFDATNMAHLYNNTQCSQDHIYSATKFSVPTIANGYVYVGAQSDNVTNVGKGTFYVFGLMTTKTCTP